MSSVTQNTLSYFCDCDYHSQKQLLVRNNHLNGARHRDSITPLLSMYIYIVQLTWTYIHVLQIMHLLHNCHIQKTYI